MNCSSFSKQPQIAVIGAGIAGLTCAYRLHTAGKNVKVFEARSRVGGRIFSAYLDLTVIELGGENLADGGKAPHIRALIHEMGLKTEDKTVGRKVYYFIDQSTHAEESLFPHKDIKPEELYKKLQDIAQGATNMKMVIEALYPSYHPYYKAISTRMEAFEGGSIEQLSPIYIDTLFHILMGGISSAHPASGDQKLVHLSRVVGGNALLPLALEKQLTGKVFLSKVVKHVSKKEGQYSLLFADGSIDFADIIVLALPCSVYGDITWEEEVIPKKRLAGITSIRYGKNAKMILPSLKRSSKLYGVVTEGAICFNNNDKRTMTLYLVGEKSNFTRDSMEATAQSYEYVFKTFFDQDVYKAFPLSYADSKQFAHYTGGVAYSWPCDPYVKGSYSYLSPGLENTLLSTDLHGKETIKSLFAPINNKVFFAGEHSSTLRDAQGTMEAACESGEKAARMILQAESIL